jgi:hypothetical protein
MISAAINGIAIKKKPSSSIGHDDRKVEADKDTGISAATVKDLLAMPSSSSGLVVETPNVLASRSLGLPLSAPDWRRHKADLAELKAAPSAWLAIGRQGR